MDPVRSSKNVVFNAFHEAKNYVGDKLKSIKQKVNSLVFPPKKELEIFHLGGTRTPVFDPEAKGKKLDTTHYFYERVPIKTSKGEIFTYGQELKPFVEQWMQAKRSGETDEDFQIWMEKKIEEPDVKDGLGKQTVRYFSDKDREQTEIHVGKDGKLTQIGLDSKVTEQKGLKGEYAFVVGEFLDEKSGKTVTKFFATPKIKTPEGKIQHSSFLRGGNVKSAGMLQMNENGSVINIQNRSGHYKPSGKEMAYLVKHLKVAGYDLSKVHVTCTKNQLFNFIANVLKINIKWGIVSESAAKWFEREGKHLIKE